MTASRPIADGLIHTKLSPPRLHGAILPRPALLARLEAGLARKLTLVAAPVGSGKSTLVADWWSTHQAVAAWFALDEGDNDPVRFWRYVLTACAKFDQSLGKAGLATLVTAQQPPFTDLLTAFINELAQLAHRYVLVLEDYHVIVERDVHESLAFLVDHLPDTLHLILITRSEPQLPLARLRARNELSELDGADLRFSETETADLLQQSLARPLPATAVAHLVEKTEGWAAGVRLAALALESKSSPEEAEQFLATFTGGHRHVLAYLTGEVLAHQPEAVRAFFETTSLLSRLTGSLCDAVTGRMDSADLLEQLEHANLFVIPLAGSDDPSWYRYHALFAEAMRHDAQRRLGPDGVRTVYANASRWYATHALLSEAIETAVLAAEPERAATLMEQLIDQQGFSELYTLLRWAEQIPAQLLPSHPALSFNYALAILFVSNDRYAPANAATIERLLRIAEAAWRREEDEARLGQVLAVRSVVHLWQGDLVKCFAAARSALELLPAGDALWRSVSLSMRAAEEYLGGRIGAAQQFALEADTLAQVVQNIHGILVAMELRGDVAFQQGDFDQAAQHYQNVLDRAVGGVEMLDDQASALLGLGQIAYERDHLEAATQHAAQALQIAEQRADEDRQVHAGILLARTALARGDIAQAHTWLRTLSPRTNRPGLLRELKAWQVRFALATNDQAAAALALAGITDADESLPRLQQEHEALAHIRFLLASGDGQPAGALLHQWQTEAHGQGRTRSEVEILCLTALAHHTHDDEEAAEQAMLRALTLALPGGFRRTFLDEGEPLRKLLRAVLVRLTQRPLAGYAATLLHMGPADRYGLGRSGAFVLLEPLSSQEERVLHLLVAGLSNQEIARELVVSINTVKTQIRSIYRKFDVNDREEARAIARELGLA